MHPAIWPQERWAENWGELCPHLAQCGLDQGHFHASEEAYTSAVGKWSGDADDKEPVKRRSSLRRSRIDRLNPPSTKGQSKVK